MGMMGGCKREGLRGGVIGGGEREGVRGRVRRG